MLHIAEYCIVTRTNQNIKYRLVVYMGSRADTVKQYHKYEKR